MFDYKRRIAAGLIGMVVSGGCNSLQKQFSSPMPEYITGIVKDEGYHGGGMFGSNYSFSIITGQDSASQQIRIFSAYENAAKIDAIITKGDVVKIKLNNDFLKVKEISLADIVEINGLPITDDSLINQ